MVPYATLKDIDEIRTAAEGDGDEDPNAPRLHTSPPPGLASKGRSRTPARRAASRLAEGLATASTCAKAVEATGLPTGGEGTHRRPRVLAPRSGGAWEHVRLVQGPMGRHGRPLPLAGPPCPRRDGGGRLGNKPSGLPLVPPHQRESAAGDLPRGRPTLLARGTRCREGLIRFLRSGSRREWPRPSTARGRNCWSRVGRRLRRVANPCCCPTVELKALCSAVAGPPAGVGSAERGGAGEICGRFRASKAAAHGEGGRS